MNVGRERAHMMFVTWLKRRHPGLYAEARRAGEAGAMSGLGTVGGFDFNRFMETISNGVKKIGEAVGAAAPAIIQAKVIKENLARAKRGEPPLDIEAIGATPIVQTNVAIDPELAESLKRDLRAGATNMLLFVGLGLGAFFLLRRVL